MRQIYIDLTTDKSPSSAGSFIGYIGEHNATELLISIPQAMVNNSDYQVLVFQAGPMVFRSGHITEDKSKNTYRDGNTIHTLLSKSVTRVTALTLQVECYKQDNDGGTSLIGKTQTVPNLMLKPSPDGYPAFNYDGSYEDVDKAIENAHKHDNLDVLHGFDVDDDGALTFQGSPVGSSAIKTYSAPAQFPETAPIGTMAFAENDDEETVIEDETITTAKEYEWIRLKFHPDITSFAFGKDFVERSSSDEKIGSATGEYLIAHEDETYVTGFGFAHIDNMISIAMASPTAYELTRMAYGKDEATRYAKQVLYIYNSIPNFTLDGLPEPLEVAWYKIISKETNFEIREYDYSITSDNMVDIVKLTEDDVLFKPYHNVGIIPCQECTDVDLQNEFLTKMLEIVPAPIKKKGLYIFTTGGWTSIDDYINSSTKIVNTFADLPDDVPVGTLANVLYDGGQMKVPDDATINKDSLYSGIYFAPFPIKEAFLFDFAVHGTYMEGTQEYTGSFDVETMFDYGIISVAVSIKFNTSKMDVYVYSLKEQTLSLDGYTKHLYEGWNKVIFLPDDDVYIRQITNLADVPSAISNPNPTESSWGYKITDLERNGVSVSSINTYFISPNPYITIDNGAGLWVKTEDGWVKTENPNEFIMKEIDL